MHAALSPQPDPGHMTPEEFRDAGRAFIDWAADYMARVQRAGESPDGVPVASRVAPGDVLSALPTAPPERREHWSSWLADLDSVIMPGVTHWQSPRFYGYFPCNAGGASILADIVSDALGAQGMMWSTSPAYTELEMRTLDWLARLLDLPPKFHFQPPTAAPGAERFGGGVIQGTASEAALVCIVAARERARTTGAPIERLTAYASAQAHSSIAKGCRIAGLPAENLRLIGVDERLRMRPDLLERAIADDRAAGRTPFLVCATIGTTASGAVDPLPAIGPIARRESLWLHADAAYAGAAAVCPEHRALLAGLEFADSFNFNPHKWLLTAFDCSALWLADRRPVIDALSITPEYLRNAASETGAVIDYRDWQAPLGRRFRALKLWFTMRWHGAEGLRAHIRAGVALGERFERLVRAEPRLELAAERCLGLVCFRVRAPNAADADARTRDLHQRLNASGRIFVSHAALPSPAPDGPARYTIRVAIGGVHTRESHIDEAFDLIRSMLQ